MSQLIELGKKICAEVEKVPADIGIDLPGIGTLHQTAFHNLYLLHTDDRLTVSVPGISNELFPASPNMCLVDGDKIPALIEFFEESLTKIFIDWKKIKEQVLAQPVTEDGTKEFCIGRMEKYVPTNQDAYGCWLAWKIQVVMENEAAEHELYMYSESGDFWVSHPVY